MLLHCNNYAFKKTPSYPPVRGRLDTETSLEEGMKKERMKGRNASGERNLSSPKGDKRGARILPPPCRGMRGGLFFS